MTPSTPTFWPARVPNQVLTEDDYNKVMNLKLGTAARWEAFRRRLNWLRDLGNYFESIRRMVDEFGTLGVVERRDGPRDGEFPSAIFVESKLEGAKAVGAAPPFAEVDHELAAPEANGAPTEKFVPKVDRFRMKPTVGVRVLEIRG